MEQKFIQFDDAVEKLGTTAEKLNELRESGELRAYRDGSSWKFRSDEIDRMLEHGIPDLPEPSDIGLVDPDDLVEAEALPDLDLADDDGLELADLDVDSDVGKPAPEPDESAMDLRLEDTDAMSAGSELELADMDDTVTAGKSDLDLTDEVPSSDPSDSILLSEEELGESVSGSPSTIIGRKELEDADLDLELDDESEDDADTKLSGAAGASDVLSAKTHGSGVLDEEEDLSEAKKAFKDLEELEIDLAAESSLALSSIGEGKPAKSGSDLSAPSDLQLELDEDESDEEGGMGSTDVPLEELAGSKGEAGSDIDLGADSDLILADAGGSDITLDSGDSGINLISPSDSGLALDDIPLDVEGSAILSSLSLEGSDPEISLLGGDSNLGQGSAAELQMDDDFQLTPLSEGGGVDEGDSSSQVIALDADLGEFDEGAAPLLEENAFDGPDEGVVLTEDFGESDAAGVGMGGYAGEVAMVPMALESEYTLGNIIGLVVVALLLTLGGMIVLDMIRNIWTWNDNLTITSGLLDALLGLFGLS